MLSTPKILDISFVSSAKHRPETLTVFKSTAQVIYVQKEEYSPNTVPCNCGTSLTTCWGDDKLHST